MSAKVWRLATDCKDSLVLRTPLAYFQGHFVGRPMKAEWQPPAIEMTGGKRRRLPDFVSWILSAPVITSRGKLALEQLVAPHAEILPMATVRGVDLYALNVLTLVVDHVQRARLVGAAFADPAVNPLPLLMQGKSINVIGGLPE